eukprot:m.173342 g.173342  ORF g.173342 m.173342 type:complete len:359 (+) comp13681_c0_seq1:140-1216(+)
MNTDNMSLLGITIDLNVFGFINAYDTAFAPNQIDDEARYAFGRQRDIGWWNLQRLRDAVTGTPYINDYSSDRAHWPESTKTRQGEVTLEEGLHWLNGHVADTDIASYNTTFDTCLAARVRLRLGLHTLYHDPAVEQQAAWATRAWVAWLTEAKPDYHHTSLALGDVQTMLYAVPTPPGGHMDGPPMHVVTADVHLLSATAQHPITPKLHRRLRRILLALQTVVHTSSLPPTCVESTVDGSVASMRAGCVATAWRHAVYRTVPTHVLRTYQTRIITERVATLGHDAYAEAALRAVSEPHQPPPAIRQVVDTPLRTSAHLSAPPTAGNTTTRAVFSWVSDALSVMPSAAHTRMQTSCGGQ